jgi:hypothetical protein
VKPIKQMNGPSGAPTPTRAECKTSSLPKTDNPTRLRKKPKIVVRLLPSESVIHIPGGRLAETMRLLISCGSRGFTSGEASVYRWARRTAAYICELRKRGIPIAIAKEAVSDGARVGRYSLDCEIEVVSDEAVEAAND